MRGLRIFCIVALCVILSACQEKSSKTDVDTLDDTAQAGGSLTVAFNAQPPTLDPFVTTATATHHISRHFYESLVTLDSNFEVVPLLAESYEVSDDGLQYTFHLRDDVIFHNGEPMTADDVVSSMERWFAHTAKAAAEFRDATIVADDEYTVTIELAEYSSVALLNLANPTELAAITPKDVAKAADEHEGVSEYIGTGPYQFEEWQADQHIHLSRFDDYIPHSSTDDSGLASERRAPADEIYFEIVTDSSTRIAGIQSGEYDLATAIPFDSAEQLENDDQVDLYVDDSGYNALVFNKQEGIFSDQKARQAVNAALDMEEILQASFSNDAFYRLNHDFMTEDQENWYTEVSQEYYNQNDLDLANELIEESQYDGEEVVLLTSRDYEDFYNGAIVIQQQLEEIGMNVTLDVYDWPTVIDLQLDPEAYDAFVTGFSTEISPTQPIFLDSQNEFPGWSDSEELDALVDEIRRADSPEDAYAIYPELLEEFWTYLPVARFGDKTTVTAARSGVEGYDYQSGIILWNTSPAD